MAKLRSDQGHPADSATATQAATQEGQRIDKWLWAARFFKTRSIASNACAAGHVKLNGQSAKPSRHVKPGDQVEMVTPGGRRLVDVCALREQRGPAPVARTLYEDQTPPEWLERPKDPLLVRDRGAGRPTKRDRRDLSRLREWP